MNVNDKQLHHGFLLHAVPAMQSAQWCSLCALLWGIEDIEAILDKWLT